MNAVLFTLEMDEQLVDMIRENPILCDSSRVKRRDLKEKNEIWEKIADTFKLKVSQCKTRWRTIKDTHIKKVKRLKAKNVPLKPFESKYSDKTLEFLDETMRRVEALTAATIGIAPDMSGEGPSRGYQFARNSSVREDSMAMFFSRISPYVEKLSPDKKTQFKNNVFEILLEVESADESETPPPPAYVLPEYSSTQHRSRNIIPPMPSMENITLHASDGINNNGDSSSLLNVVNDDIQYHIPVEFQDDIQCLLDELEPHFMA